MSHAAGQKESPASHGERMGLQGDEEAKGTQDLRRHQSVSIRSWGGKGGLLGEHGEDEPFVDRRVRLAEPAIRRLSADALAACKCTQGRSAGKEKHHLNRRA